MYYFSGHASVRVCLPARISACISILRSNSTFLHSLLSLSATPPSLCIPGLRLSVHPAATVIQCGGKHTTIPRVCFRLVKVTDNCYKAVFFFHIYSINTCNVFFFFLVYLLLLFCVQLKSQINKRYQFPCQCKI